MVWRCTTWMLSKKRCKTSICLYYFWSETFCSTLHCSQPNMTKPFGMVDSSNFWNYAVRYTYYTHGINTNIRFSRRPNPLDPLRITRNTKPHLWRSRDRYTRREEHTFQHWWTTLGPRKMEHFTENISRYPKFQGHGFCCQFFVRISPFVNVFFNKFTFYKKTLGLGPKTDKTDMFFSQNFIVSWGSKVYPCPWPSDWSKIVNKIAI